ncbi:hypothetical protein [Nonomuraea rubra]|uniref:hypothetical protein n=1 Tax=Nonomuraea rubra TaxID=46180 RepID=UPI0031F15A09
MRDKRPRFDVDRDERRRITERFMGASAGGDLDALIEMFSDQVSIISDGGGKCQGRRCGSSPARERGPLPDVDQHPANIRQVHGLDRQAELADRVLRGGDVNNAPPSSSRRAAR